MRLEAILTASSQGCGRCLFLPDELRAWEGSHDACMKNELEPLD
jgi:hypothetical protein